MAKLDGVKVIDAKDGEITRIEYNGEEYINIGRKGGQDGDIGLRTEEADASHARAGEYYPIISDGGLRFKDDEGDSPLILEYLGNFVYFRKSTSPSVKVGDKVRITNAFRTYGLYDNGDILTVKSIEEEAGVVYVTVEENSGIIYPKEFEIISRDDLGNIRWEQIGRKPYEFRKGDIVRVIDVLGTDFLKEGQLTEVVTPDGTSAPLVLGNNGVTVFAIVELVAPVEQRFDKQEYTKGRR